MARSTQVVAKSVYDFFGAWERYLELAAVNHINHILNGQTGLSNVGGQDHLARALWRALKYPALRVTCQIWISECSVLHCS